MSTRKDVPRNGPARMLSEADPDISFDELAQRLETLPRWECTSCGKQKFTRPQTCSRCSASEFQKTVPEEGGTNA